MSKHIVMDAIELKQKFSKIKSWQRNGERAPHKPLLLLYALSRINRNETRLISYSEAKDSLMHLLVEFGPNRRTTPRYPFIRLSNDGIWQITGKKDIDTRHDWTEQIILENETMGGFTEEVYSLIFKDKNLIRELANIILEQNFPETMREDILNEIGLDMELAVVQSRNPQFRERILRAYEYRCAVCGFSVRLGNVLVAVEAAHIKWHQAGGPDIEDNGIALCTMHHKLFDRGVFTISDNLKFQVSESAHGTVGFEEWLMKYHGENLRPPQSPTYRPKDTYINWHFKEVFRGPTRYISD